MKNILKSDNKHGIALAILAAVCYSISSPLSKLILGYLIPTLMAGFLYLGAGLCMLIIFLIKLIFKKRMKKIEMLFIDDDKRGNGIGNALVEYAKTKFNVNKVIIDGTNYSAHNFYLKKDKRMTNVEIMMSKATHNQLCC